MATYTPNLNLKKPSTSEHYDVVGDLNDSKDKIDLAVGNANSQLADNAISPDAFLGSDYEKVQSAINYAILNNKSIRFSRIYDITGSIINIPYNLSRGRRPLNLWGVGGGIRKDDSGYMFNSDHTGRVGDIYSTNMKYEGISGAGMTVWNGNKLMRITSSMDAYTNIDKYIDGNDGYVQSVKFIKCTMTGGSGWAFEWSKSYDVLIDGNTIEHRQHGIRNVVFTNNPDNDNLRIVNNVIEGFTGKTMELGSSFAVVIQGNYFEQNIGGYIDMSLSENFHNGLTIIGNSFQMSAIDITNNIPAIKLGKMGSNGVFSSGNVSSGVLYELVNAGNPGLLTSVSDNSYTDENAIGYTAAYRELSRSSRNPFSKVDVYNAASGLILFTQNEIKTITIPMGVAIDKYKDMVTVGLHAPTGTYTITVLSYRVVGSDIIVRVRNDQADQSINVYATVWQVK